MPATIDLVHDYATTPEALWRVATDWSCLQEAVKGIVTYHGLPSAPLHQGQVARVKFQLFGAGPKQDWTMEVLEHDAARMIVRSREHGGAVRRWAHRLEVTATSGGARLAERIEIGAGLATPLYAAWARFMYKRRHRPRLAMLGLR